MENLTCPSPLLLHATDDLGPPPMCTVQCTVYVTLMVAKTI